MYQEANITLSEEKFQHPYLGKVKFSLQCAMTGTEEGLEV
jgi:hypothetical protein